MSLNALDVAFVPVIRLCVVDVFLDLVDQRAHHLGVAERFCLLRVHAFGRLRHLVVVRVSSRCDERLIEKRIAVLGFRLVTPQLGQEGIDAPEKSIVDDAFVLEGFDLMLALGSLHVDLALLRPNEGALVDIGMGFEVRIVGELEGIPLAVVDWHVAQMNRVAQGSNCYRLRGLKSLFSMGSVEVALGSKRTDVGCRTFLQRVIRRGPSFAIFFCNSIVCELRPHNFKLRSCCP